MLCACTLNTHVRSILDQIISVHLHVMTLAKKMHFARRDFHPSEILFLKIALIGDQDLKQPMEIADLDLNS